MSAEFGAPVDVIINPTSNAEGETIVNIPLGAVFKFLRDTGEWSKEDYVGPVLATKPHDSNDHLDIQLYNRRSIYNIKIKFYRNSGYHRTDNIIMMKTSDGTVYGLASNNDYYEQLNMLEEKLKEFVEAPISPSFNSSRTSSPLLLSNTDSTRNESYISDISSPLKPINIDNNFNPMGFYSPFQQNALPIKQEKEFKWHTKPCMIPASVYRRAAAPPKNASRASSVTPISMNTNDKLFSNLDAEKNWNYRSPQNITQINGSPVNKTPQNNSFDEFSQRSRLLSMATASNTSPNERMDAVTKLINFAFVEGNQRGKQNVEELKETLLGMSNNQLLNVLEDVLTKKPDVKNVLLEKFN
uniref:Uncharacterized protein n=1 Tax=Panagrolaimus superbus TaxID=310955 RepID=A0A914ZB90_9BILA